jgi:hypothetical protein
MDRDPYDISIMVVSAVAVGFIFPLLVVGEYMAAGKVFGMWACGLVVVASMWVRTGRGK